MYTVKSDADLTLKKNEETWCLKIIKLSQLITFYSDKKPIYEILCVIKQHADSTRVKQVLQK